MGKEEDYRYAAMREKHGKRFPFVSLVTGFGLQGLLMWVMSWFGLVWDLKPVPQTALESAAVPLSTERA